MQIKIKKVVVLLCSLIIIQISFSKENEINTVVDTISIDSLKENQIKKDEKRKYFHIMFPEYFFFKEIKIFTNKNQPRRKLVFLL